MENHDTEASAHKVVYLVIPTRFQWDEDSEFYYPDGYETPMGVYESRMRAEMRCLKATLDFLEENDDGDEPAYALRYFRHLFDSMRYVRDPFTDYDAERISKIKEAAATDPKFAYGMFMEFLLELSDWKATKLLTMIGVTPFHVTKLVLNQD
jgi:hypothetical protein